MKKRNCIALAIVLLGTALCVWIYLHPRQLPVDQCSEVYRQYEANPRVEAAFLKDFRIDDSVTFDVTLLAATDEEGWDTLRCNFDIPRYSQKAVAIMDSATASSKIAPKRDYSQPPDSNHLNNDIIVFFLLRHVVCVFHIENEEQYNAMFKYLMDESKKKLKHQKLLNNKKPLL